MGEWKVLVIHVYNYYKVSGLHSYVRNKTTLTQRTQRRCSLFFIDKCQVKKIHRYLEDHKCFINIYITEICVFKKWTLFLSFDLGHWSKIKFIFLVLFDILYQGFRLYYNVLYMWYIVDARPVLRYMTGLVNKLDLLHRYFSREFIIQENMMPKIA